MATGVIVKVDNGDASLHSFTPGGMVKLVQRNPHNVPIYVPYPLALGEGHTN